MAEDYDEESATAHVRRVLDIVACTTCFGPSPPPPAAAPAPPLAPSASGHQKKDVSPSVDGDVEMGDAQLGCFYEFFSLSNLTPPVQCI